MAEFVRRVFGRGKITIPFELRELLEIGDGDLVRFRIVEVAREPKTDAERENAQSVEVFHASLQPDEEREPAGPKIVEVRPKRGPSLP